MSQTLIAESIRFSIQTELDQVICDFEAVCGLPYCGGAIDGTFMQIKKKCLNMVMHTTATSTTQQLLYLDIFMHAVCSHM